MTEMKEQSFRGVNGYGIPLSHVADDGSSSRKLISKCLVSKFRNHMLAWRRRMTISMHKICNFFCVHLMLLYFSARHTLFVCTIAEYLTLRIFEGNIYLSKFHTLCKR